MANEDQIAYWNGGAADSWVAEQERLDRQNEPLGRAVLAWLAPQPGETIADIGCGAGQTTLALAERVAPGGRVVGFDISRQLLERARQRVPAAEFVEGDVQVHDLGDGVFDAVFSRFGVMFFTDPVAAFANLHRALRPGGRLAFVCWRRVEENPIMTVPLAAAATAGVPMPPPPADPHAPGPFAFADRDRLRGILETAGFADIAIEPQDMKVGGNDLDASLELALRVGPLGRLLREAPQFRDQAIAAVRDAVAKHIVDGVAMIDSATWIVTARRSPA